ncbi:hypothetical protein [Thermithiobacillus plumbiphilus]|uniref:Uncharacterized protein n=1 Tax=Thermithiobacillus plumbiphilus TaxID=1729899 RepID=A0ABU9D829_9PROT
MAKAARALISARILLDSGDTDASWQITPAKMSRLKKPAEAGFLR